MSMKILYKNDIILLCKYTKNRPNLMGRFKAFINLKRMEAKKRNVRV